MGRRRKNDGGGAILAFIIGIPAFLMMVYPVIFWLVFVPIVVFVIVKVIMWLKK